MRLATLLLAAALAALLATQAYAITITSVNASTTQNGTNATSYQLLYQIRTDVPASCTVNQAWRNPGTGWQPISTSNFVRVSNIGSLIARFWLTAGPGSYRASLSCSATCGTTGNTACSGDERAEPPGTSPYSCPQDCGCGGTQSVFGVTTGATPVCAAGCPNVLDTWQGNYYKQKCTTTPGPAETYTIDTTRACQMTAPNTYPRCTVCEPGLYIDRFDQTEAAKGCVKFLWNDGICRSDYGEPYASDDCYCGDSICNGPETCTSCTADCGGCAAPQITSAGPEGTIGSQNSVTLYVNTNVASTCRWSSTGQGYNSMPAANEMSSPGTTSHTFYRTGLTASRTYDVFFSCKETATGTAMTTWYGVTFTTASPVTACPYTNCPVGECSASTICSSTGQALPCAGGCWDYSECSDPYLIC